MNSPFLSRKILSCAARFLRARSGNITIIFGLSLLPVVGVVGAAVDYAQANKIRTQLQAAADSAALGAIAKNSSGYLTAVNMSGDGDVGAGTTEATNIFNALIAGNTGFTKPTLSVSVSRKNNTVMSAVSFSTSVSTFFLGSIGYKQIAVSGLATASSSFPTYIDFYLLLDNTPSMGVGARTTDIERLQSNTSDRCAFACHDLSTYPNDYYGLAKRLGVTMRIDVVRQATQALMATAINTQVVPNQFRMAIYTFGANAANTGLTAIQSLTTNLSAAATSAAAIDLMSVNYQNYAGDTDSNIPGVLSSLNAAIAAPGAGTRTAPKKYVFFVSDGVTDRVTGSTACLQPNVTSQDPQTRVNYTRCQEPLNVAICNTMKTRGIMVGVLYTTYLPLPANDWYNSYIAPFSTSISANMKACASPGLFFEVGPNQGISEAMLALFKAAITTSHLTQ